MNKQDREDIIQYIIGHLEAIEDLLDEWQDMERTYTPAERQLDVRLDRSIMPV